MKNSVRHANIAVFVPHNGCPHTCAFCNQKTISGSQRQPEAADVVSAIETAIASLGENASQSELAFFGGSFTAIERGYMVSLLEAAAPYVRSGKIGGIRCSTRPDCIDEDVLSLLKDYGVTAIELGAQSMDDRVLELNERGHTADQVRHASALIKSFGIELGLQMMTGLYGDTDDGARFTARELAALEPATVRIYPTVVLRGTRLAELCESGEFETQGVEGAVALCAELLRFFEDKDIKVIRLGLHAGEDVERDYIAGAYHPALRELCESRIFLDKAKELLAERAAGEVTLAVNPSDISKMTGQRKANMQALAELGYKVKITGCPEISKGSIVIKN